MSERQLGDAASPSVSLAEIDQQRALGWPDFHPEDFCHRCGGRNLSWWVDGDAWNATMRPDGPDSPGLWNEIICPQCFAELFQARFPNTSWRLSIDPDTIGGRAFAAALKHRPRCGGTHPDGPCPVLRSWRPGDDEPVAELFSYEQMLEHLGRLEGKVNRVRALASQHDDYCCSRGCTGPGTCASGPLAAVEDGECDQSCNCSSAPYLAALASPVVHMPCCGELHPDGVCPVLTSEGPTA